MAILYTLAKHYPSAIPEITKLYSNDPNIISFKALNKRLTSSESTLFYLAKSPEGMDLISKIIETETHIEDMFDIETINTPIIGTMNSVKSELSRSEQGRNILNHLANLVRDITVYPDSSSFWQDPPLVNCSTLSNKRKNSIETELLDNKRVRLPSLG
ncbi:MAG: hypothetical protein VXW87_03445 [Pseudomonadota bacterium]|nr:hypothetical protein [Pseudomonadota bacterium]